MKKRIFRDFFWVSMLFVFVWPSSDSSWAAEKYPSRPIAFYCSIGAGGMTDLITRAAAKGLEKYLGVPVIPGNRPGGGGVVNYTAIANSPPDGYNISIAGMGLFHSLLVGHATYSLEDFRIVCQLITANNVMAVRADAPWKTFQEFLDYERKTPGVKYAHPGIGTLIYLRFQNIIKSANLKMVGVPFRSDAETVPALLGNHVTAGLYGYAGAKTHVDAGKMRILFSFDPPAQIGIDPSIPDILTTFGKDVADRDVPVHMLVIVPRKTPDETVQILQQALEKVTKDPEFNSTAKKLYIAVNFLDGNTFTQKELPRIMSNFKAVLK